MTRARSLSRLANSQAFTVDGDLDVGINSTSPSSKLDVDGDINVTGVITATSFYGDGSNLVGIATTSLELPAASEGEALIYENSAWVAGPAIVDYRYIGGNGGDSSVYTVPTGFSLWTPEFNTSDTTTSPAADITLTNSNRTATSTSSSSKMVISTTAKSTGKWYWEVRPTVITTIDNFTGIVTNINAGFPGATGSGGIGFRRNGNSPSFNDAGATINYFSGNYLPWNANDVIQIAIDLDNKKLWYGVNNTWENSGDPSAGTGEFWNNWTGTPDFYLAHRLYGNTDSIDLVGYAATGGTLVGSYTIDNLDDVDTSTVAPVDGQALVWDNGTSKWKPGIATNAQGLTGNPSISVTDITATGNVSIAGTLTYEDVTNVDSIGIITAQSGIDVTGGGINVTGVVTATSFSGDGSNLTGISTVSNATAMSIIFGL